MSKNYTILLLSMAVLALGIVSFVISLPSSKDTAEEATAPLNPNEEMTTRESSLSSPPPATVATDSVSMMGVPSSLPSTHSGDKITVDKEIHKKLDLTQEEYRTQLEKQFVSENPDIEWSFWATSKLAQDITSHLPPGSELVDVDCRKSMCRVRADNASPEGFDKLSRAMVDMTKDDWTGGMLLVADSPPESTHNITTVFLGRSGSPLPDPVEVAR